MRIGHRLPVLCALVVLCGFSSSARSETDLELVAQIDSAVTKAVGFLVSRQSSDGAWRSDVYAPFKEGDALSPLVMTALLPLPIDDDTEAACERGHAYLVELSKRTFENENGLKSLAYPVYTAANTTIALHQNRRAEDEAIRAKWVRTLRDLQLNQATGWKPEDIEFGGWTYGHAAAGKPTDEGPLGTLDQPNMSATAFALTALHAAGVPASDPAFRSGVSFVERLRNADGGFIFVHGDEVRNKAGRTTGANSESHEFSSYGSTTADGIRVLVLSGRELHAILGKHAQWRWPIVDSHPGEFAKDRRSARNGTYFYYLSSIGRTLKVSGQSSVRNIPAEMVTALIKRQCADGFWKNEVVDQREDDPLIATSFAIQALTACRALLTHAERPVLNQAKNQVLTCHARDATCHGAKLQFEQQPHKNTLGCWLNENDSASWRIATDRPGQYEVFIWQGCGAGQGGSKLAIGIGDEAIQSTVENTGHFQHFAKRSVGKLNLPAGMHPLTLKCTNKSKAAIADVRQIQLVPIEKQ